MLSRVFAPLLRLAFHHFYNRFAFTYDFVAHLVSGGDWVAWTYAAVPFLRGPRVLELAFGTGNLHLALAQKPFVLFGLDLSAYMIEITRRKFARAGRIAHLVRGGAQAIPLRANYFDEVVVTFPASFILATETQDEIARVLKRDGQLIWVDGARVKPQDAKSRFLNWALDITSGGSERQGTETKMPRGIFAWRVERVQLETSHVQVMIGTPILNLQVHPFAL